MLPILQLGPLSIRTPGLALLLGLWLALDVAQRLGAARGLNGDRIYTFGLVVIASGIIGARLSFVLVNLPLYFGIKPWTQALLSVAALAPGTEMPLVGMIIAAAVAIWLCRRWNFSVLTTLDVLAPAVVILIAFIGLATLLSGEMYGVQTLLPWHIYLWAEYRHPTQLYLSLAAILILALLWRIGALRGITSPSHTPNLHPGTIAQITLILLSVTVLLIEPLRADSPVMFGGIRTWEVLALLTLIAVLSSFALNAPTVPSNDQISTPRI